MSEPNILDQPIKETNHQAAPSVGWWFEYAGIACLLAAIIAYFLPNAPTGDQAIYIYSFKGLFLKFSALAIYFHLVGGLYLYINRKLGRQSSLLFGQVHFLLSIAALTAAGLIIFQLSRVEPNQDLLGLFLNVSSLSSKVFIGAQALLLHLFFTEKNTF